MSLSEKIAENKAAMNRLYSLTADIVKNKRKFAVLADNTLKVGGMALTALTTFIRGAVNSHIGLTGKAAHNDSAASVGIISKDQWAAVQAPLLPSGICPISRYGSNNYLPTGILGTFESGTTTFNPKTGAAFFEDDGTLVYLRNATNGSIRGTYYAYAPGASKPTQQPTKTNRKYRPTWIPAGLTVQQIFSCSSSIIFGRLQDANGVPGDYFVAATNGTFDDSKHTGGLITPAEYALMGGQQGECFVADNTVYYYALVFSTSGAVPFRVKMSSVPLATVQAANGGYIDFHALTGINTTGFGNVVTSGADYAQFCAKIMSTVAADNPMVLNSGAFASTNAMYYGWPAMVSALGPDGLIRTKIWSQARYVTNTAPYAAMTFSWTYNPVTKEVKLDPGFDVQSTATYSTVAAEVYGGPIFQALQYDALSSSGAQSSFYAFDNSGNVFRCSNQNTVDAIVMVYGKVTGWTSKYDALKCLSQTTVGNGGVSNQAQYGSALGGNLISPIPLSASVLLLQADGLDAAGKWRRGFAYTMLEDTPTYTYKSLYSGSLTGYKPSSIRKFIVDDGKVEVNYAATVQEVSTGGVITVTGRRYLTGMKTTGPSIINPDLSIGPLVSISTALAQSLVDMVTSQLVGLGITPIASGGVRCDLVIPTALAVPPFVMVNFVTTDGKHGITLAKVNLSTDAPGNVIAIASIDAILAPYYAYTTGGASLGFSSTNSNCSGACSIYEVADAFLIGASNVWNMNIPGSSALASMAFKYKKSTSQFVANATYNMVVFNHYTSSRAYLSHPDLGFGVNIVTLAETGISDDSTKSVFLPIAKTEAEFDAWVKGNVPPIAQRVVLASQEVAQGWIVYFSEPVPVVIGGKYFVMPVQSFDLSLLFTQEGALKNKTFYIYLKQSGDTCAYSIDAGPSPEGIGTMFLGTITTNDVKITSIVTDKVTRIGTFRLNTEALGSSIPVSNGLPSSPDTLEWS